MDKGVTMTLYQELKQYENELSIIFRTKSLSNKGGNAVIIADLIKIYERETGKTVGGCGRCKGRALRWCATTFNHTREEYRKRFTKKN